MNRPGKYISKMNHYELCKKAREFVIFGLWFMLNSELRHCIKKVLGMTKDEGFVE